MGTNNDLLTSLSYNLLVLKKKVKGPILTFVKTDFRDQDILGLCDNYSLANQSLEYSVYSCISRGKEFVLVTTGSAAANLITALYELSNQRISALIRVGATGGRTVNINEVVVAKESLCRDAVSKQLTSGKDKVHPNRQLTDKIIAGLNRDEIPHVNATVASIDAMYFFEKEVKRAEMTGAAYWDLETATVLAFGHRYRIPAASILLSVTGRHNAKIKTYPPIERIDFVKSILTSLTS
jgi:uridine phosphorylase